MTVAEKINLLRGIFRQNSNLGVLTWGPTANGYCWNCESPGVAKNLAQVLIDHVKLLGLDHSTFPFRFQPPLGTSVIFEPIADSPQHNS